MMKRRDTMLMTALALLLALTPVAASADVHEKRREALMSQAPDGLILVRGAASDEINWNFYYLTGIHEPGAAVLLAPRGTRVETGRRYPGPSYIHGRMVRQILFLPTVDSLAAAWGEDSAVTVDGAGPGKVGFDAVYGMDDLERVLSSALGEHGVLQIVRSGEPSLGGPAGPDPAFVKKVRERFFGATIREVTSIVEEMRRVKDDTEIELIQRAVDLSNTALRQAMETVRPGMFEYQLEGAITHVYRGAGAGHAFASIVGSGPNAVLLHYTENQGEIGAGELVLIDTGASVDGYNSDITRTFPAGGRFSVRQREVYETVLRAVEAALAQARPGAFLGDLHATAYEVIEQAGFGQYFIHGLSHMLGLETHDVGDVHLPLVQGVVFTIEPGIYIPEEGIGVRIEEVVVVTGDGARLLSADIPVTVDEIEALTTRARAER
jgi:Xaa-Pro aminopeptidase